jgi:hypothetical protein
LRGNLLPDLLPYHAYTQALGLYHELHSVLKGRHSVFYFERGDIEQQVQRQTHNPKVVGSNPTPATKIKHKIGPWNFRGPLVLAR